jgi:hypothetical protein
MPRHATAHRQLREHPADQPCAARPAGDFSDDPVGGDLAARHPRDDRQDGCDSIGHGPGPTEAFPRHRRGTSSSKQFTILQASEAELGRGLKLVTNQRVTNAR